MWIAIILGLGAFVVNSHLTEKSKREAQKAEKLRAEEARKAAVAQVTSRHNAVANWEKQLSKGERYRLSPILTIELEQLWQRDRPVLFIGSMKDVSSAGADAYHVLVEKSLFNMYHLRENRL